MKTLLWREFHWSRLVLVIGLGILLVPYVVLLAYAFWTGNRIGSNEVSGTAGVSIMLFPLTILFLGGNAFAGERADRSTEFLGYLPISRKHRLLSKLCLILVVFAVVVFANLLVFRIAEGWFPWQDRNAKEILRAMSDLASTGAVLFGVAWMISSFQSSPTFAICGGIAVPMLTGACLSLVTTVFDLDPDERFLLFDWYRLISLTLGAIGFGLGTWLFLKRVEP